MKLALSMLCENPLRKTGLTTLFHEFVQHGLELFPDLRWLLYKGSNQDWSIRDPRLEICEDYPANDQLATRLRADHLWVPASARRKGADVLVTVGFVPLRKCLPTAMHVFSLQHLNPDNRVGFGRELYRRWLMKYSWPKADLIITNSDFARNQILSVLPGFENRIVKSYEGLQHEQFNATPRDQEAARMKKELDLDPGYLLWISNFYPYKQPELLLKAYAGLDVQWRQRHPLVMVGGNWERVLESTRELAKNLGIERNVRFLGWISDEWLAPLYRQALAFCLASREETFGRCVIEAMACGTPCLVNDIPIMHEVTDGKAIIVDFNDTTSVTQELLRLISDGSLRDRLRKEGLANALRFDFDKLATERLQAIQEIRG